MPSYQPTIALENLGDDPVGGYCCVLFILSEFGHYAFHVVVGDLLAKDANVLEEFLHVAYGTRVLGLAALADHVLLEASWDFLSVAVVVAFVFGKSKIEKAKRERQETRDDKERLL